MVSKSMRCTYRNRTIFRGSRSCPGSVSSSRTDRGNPIGGIRLKRQTTLQSPRSALWTRGVCATTSFNGRMPHGIPLNGTNAYLYGNARIWGGATGRMAVPPGRRHRLRAPTGGRQRERGALPRLRALGRSVIHHRKRHIDLCLRGRATRRHRPAKEVLKISVRPSGGSSAATSGRATRTSRCRMTRRRALVRAFTEAINLNDRSARGMAKMLLCGEVRDGRTR